MEVFIKPLSMMDFHLLDTMDTAETGGESELVEVKKEDEEEAGEEEDEEGKEKKADKREEENTLLTNGRLSELFMVTEGPNLNSRFRYLPT